MAKTRSERSTRAPSQEPSADAADIKQKRTASKGSERQACDTPRAMGKWFPSATSEEEVQSLKDQLLMPADLATQISEGEVPPMPHDGEHVLCQEYLRRGLLRFFRCQLHHIPPNEVLHITNFITFCECFLRIAPHFKLF